jgi:hypothetical protein
MRAILPATLSFLTLFAFLLPDPSQASASAKAVPASKTAAAPAREAGGFEGIIDLNISLEAGAGDLRLYKSGERAKLDMKLSVDPLPAPIRLGVLLDPAQPKVLFLVNDNLRTYSSIDIASMATVSDTAYAGKYTLKVLGKEKLLGHECTHLTLTRHRELVDAWITRDYPDVYAVLKKLQEANPQFGQAEAFRALEAAGQAGLPLRCIVVRDGQRVTTEVKRIQAKALAASLFTVPADYKRSELAGGAGLQPTPEQMKKIIQGALESE